MSYWTRSYSCKRCIPAARQITLSRKSDFSYPRWRVWNRLSTCRMQSWSTRYRTCRNDRHCTHSTKAAAGSPQLLCDWWSASFAALPLLVTPSNGNHFRLPGSQHRMSGKPRFIFLALFHYATLPAPWLSDEWALFCGQGPLWLPSTKPDLACRGSHTSGGCLSRSRLDSDECAREAIVRFCLGFVLGFHKLLWRRPKPYTFA